MVRQPNASGCPQVEPRVAFGPQSALASAAVTAPADNSGPGWQDTLKAPIESLGQGVMDFFESVGKTTSLGVEALVWLVRPPYRFHLVLEQAEFVGVGSLFIVMLTGLFTGLVMALQSSFAFAKFSAESLVGATVVISLCRELAPVLTGLMVTGRAGSAIATELGTMRVSEQIDALETMAVSPVQYLVVPRVIALTLCMPLLTMLFNAVGFVGAYMIGVFQIGIDVGTFMGRIHQIVDVTDLLGGLFKSAVFGFAIALIACQKGMNASGGSKGVGEAATKTVVSGSVIILLLDYVLTSMLLTVFGA